MTTLNLAQNVVLLTGAQFRQDLRCHFCISANIKCTLLKDIRSCTPCLNLNQECLFTRSFEKTAGPLDYDWDSFTSESARGALTAAVSTAQEMQGNMRPIDSTKMLPIDSPIDYESSTLKDDDVDHIEDGDRTRLAQVKDHKKSETTQKGQGKSVQAPAAISPLPAIGRKVAKVIPRAMKQPHSNKDETTNAGVSDPMTEGNSVQRHVKKTGFKLPSKRPATPEASSEDDSQSSHSFSTGVKATKKPKLEVAQRYGLRMQIREDSKKSDPDHLFFDVEEAEKQLKKEFDETYKERWEEERRQELLRWRQLYPLRSPPILPSSP